MLKILSGLVFAFLLVGNAVADEAHHRQLGAHVHGAGTLDIAIEGTTVSLELVAPGMDIVGFEHPASSDEQKAVVKTAEATLAKVMTLFKIPDSAKCTVETASAEARSESGHKEDSDHDAHHPEDNDHDHDAAAEGGHAGHSEFHAAYRLQCAAPENLTRVDTAYFSDFPGAQSLSVTIVSAKGQTQAEMTREKPTLDLTGVM